MKRLILSALAATLAASPLAASVADAQQRTTTTVVHRANGSTVTTRTVVRQPTWRAGQRFNYRTAPNYRRINEYRTYRLRAPQRGYYWARSGRDAVLVRGNGTVVEVRSGLFR